MSILKTLIFGLPDIICFQAHITASTTASAMDYALHDPTTSHFSQNASVKIFLDYIGVHPDPEKRASAWACFSSLTLSHVLAVKIFTADYDNNERKIVTALSVARFPAECLENIVLFVFSIMKPFRGDIGKKYSAEFIYHFINAIDLGDQEKMVHPITRKPMKKASF